jgi:hypothetical protein
MGLQDTVATYSPQQTSHLLGEIRDAQRQALNRAYNEGMANAQRTMLGAHGGAIGIGAAGYSTWSALSRSFFSSQVQHAIASGERLAQVGTSGNTPTERTVTGSGDLQIDTDGTGPSHGDPYHRNVTSYQPNGRSLNADRDPYVAVPTSTQSLGVRAGDRAILSGNRRSAGGVVGDFGSPGWGEASPAMARGIGIGTRNVPHVGPVPDTPGGRAVPVTITVYPSGPSE